MRSDPHEPEARLERFAKSPIDEEWLSAVNRALANCELPAVAGQQDIARLPIIYIVGVPRSGTTLLSQLMSRHLSVGYINNLTARFWLRPSAGIRLSKILLGHNYRKFISLTSTYGVTEGIVGPHEFGYFWRHWLNLDQAPTHHLTAEAVDTLDKEGLKHALENEILAPFEAPVVFKNVICGFHASFLTSIHPSSLFVHIKRDPYSTAASILKARHERHGSYDAWWSLKPSTYRLIEKIGDPAKQVGQQVADCLYEMEIELSKPSVKFVDVSYEELCVSPKLTLDKIMQAIRQFDFYVDVDSGELPRLTPNNANTLPPKLQSDLRAFFSSTTA